MQALPAALQELTSKDDLGGATGVRWTLLSPSTSVDEDRQTRRGGNVTFSDYSYAYHTQTNTGTASFLYLDPLTKAMSLTLYYHISRSALSLYDTISYEYGSPW